MQIGWGQMDVSGRVLDDKGRPIVGVYIIHLQSEHHAHTNELGVFQLNHVNEGDTLQIHHLGFKNRRHILRDGAKDLEIILEESLVLLDEIVVGQN